MRVAPYDIDTAPAAQAAERGGLARYWRGFNKSQIGRIVLDEARIYRRWRPAVIMGDGAPEFAMSYFHPPPAVPWLGSVWARGAVTCGHGMTFVGHHALVGCGLMRHPSLFPTLEPGLSVKRLPEGDYEALLPVAEKHLNGVTCNLISPGLAIYGHWLLDLLPRLALCQSMEIKVDRYIVGGVETPWKNALLEMIGAPLDKIVYFDGERASAACDFLYLPTFCRFDSEVRPELLHVCKTIATQIAPSKPKRRLFVSRSAWNGSRPLNNREEIEQVFQKKGFEIIMPETLPLHDVIEAFASAAIVVGECGSGLHNAIFCQSSTRLGVIQSETNRNFLSAQLAMWQEQEVWYLIGSERGSRGLAGGFHVSPMTAKLFAESILA